MFGSIEEEIAWLIGGTFFVQRGKAGVCVDNCIDIHFDLDGLFQIWDKYCIPHGWDWTKAYSGAGPDDFSTSIFARNDGLNPPDCDWQSFVFRSTLNFRDDFMNLLVTVLRWQNGRR